MHPVTAAALALTLLLAGCSSPDATLPGVYTDSAITDKFRCGALLGPDGCVIVRFDEVHSGCSPEVPGYVECNATVEWSATSGAALPGSRLVVEVNGTEVGDCEVPQGRTCRVAGVTNMTHSFDGPGERHPWTLEVRARLEGPAIPEATGEFTLRLDLVMRTQDGDATDVEPS